jgi:hypothetical protein
VCVLFQELEEDDLSANVIKEVSTRLQRTSHEMFCLPLSIEEVLRRRWNFR